MANGGNQGLTTTHKILIGGFAAVIAVTVGLFVFLFPKSGEQSKSDKEYVPKENLIVTEDNAESVDAQMAAMAEDNMFTVSMNGVWTFKNGEAASHDAIMENHPQNTQDMFVTVVLEETGEEVYRSDAVSPGKAISDIKLTKDLEPGEYSALAVHHPLLADGTEETEVNFRITLVVEE